MGGDGQGHVLLHQFLVGRLPVKVKPGRDLTGTDGEVEGAGLSGHRSLHQFTQHQTGLGLTQFAQLAMGGQQVQAELAGGVMLPFSGQLAGGVGHPQRFLGNPDGACYTENLILAPGFRVCGLKHATR